MSEDAGSRHHYVSNVRLRGYLLLALIAREIVAGAGGDGSKRDIFTRGNGISDYPGEWPLQGLSVPTPTGVIIGCVNDAMGPRAFETLDRVAIEYWQENIVQSGSTGGQAQSVQAPSLPGSGVRIAP